MITRLQLGASRLELLGPAALKVFLDKAWLHLGAERPKSISRGLKRRLRGALGRFTKPRDGDPAADELYGLTNFKEFFYRKGDLLPLESCSIDFIFSEHFFEHLFLDEASTLLRECHRILRPLGVIRTCVPDSDLRTYEPPEPEGFPDINLPPTHPDKHKTRWSVYSLTNALRDAGFEPVPLRYCNMSGRYIRVDPADIRESYGGCPDHEMIFDTSYIKRMDSLIVDGIRKPSG